MAPWLLTLPLVASALSEVDYLFAPQGRFAITVTSAGPYYFSDFHLERANIYLDPENRCILYGTIEKVNDPCCSYIFRIQNEMLSSAGIDALETCEIRDERGSVIGRIEGKKETHGPFLFFDEHNCLFAQATFDDSLSEFIIRSSEGSVCSTKCFKYPGVSSSPDYYWTLKEVSGSLDPRFLWPFVAFISETYWRNVPSERYD